MLVEEQANETAELKNKFVALKDEVDRHIRGYNSCSSSTPSTPRPSKRLPLELSTAVGNLQEKGPEDLKYAGDKLYGSEQNYKVKISWSLSCHNSLLTSTHQKNKTKFKIPLYPAAGAMHRYVESRKRKCNDSRPGRVDIAKKVKHESKKKEARKNLYNSHKKHLKSEKERKVWSEINFQYLTEESSCDETFIKRIIPWRSEALNKLIGKLDKSAYRKNATKRNFTKKEWLQKSPSKSPPPRDSPSWTV